jgi:two-component system, LytTR family, sensor kinase
LHFIYNKMSTLKLQSKGFRIALHALVWAAVFLLPIYLIRPPLLNIPVHFFLRSTTIINDLLLVILFYLNAYLFIPDYFNKKYWFVYLMLVILSISILIFISDLTENYIDKQFEFPHHKPIELKIFPSLLVLAVSTAYGIIVKYEKQKKERETENLKTELQFLRSQINPHFLFNTLNNLVSLARKKSDMLEPSLLKLSGLMQYMLIEPENDRVNVMQEVDYLKNYIELQKLRFDIEVKISFECDETGLQQYDIAPMLLIPFVENAFKHGVGMLDDREISIRFSVKDSQLYFEVKNNFNAQTQEQKDKSSGIGLLNVRKRLNLLYPSNYNLDILIEGNWHIVNLRIKLV